MEEDKSSHMGVPDSEYVYRIAVLIPYYGSWPKYFGLFLNSCVSNADIDFVLITDLSIPHGMPRNVRVVPVKFKDLQTLITVKTGIRVNFSDPYKLCDFRPAFGLVFSELLVEYDFWGYGDIDVIYGNIKAFITNKVLNAHDMISVRKEYMTGFFSLYRNTPEICNVFRKSRDYEIVFSSELYYCFDECNFNHLPLWNGMSIFKLDASIQCMTYVVKKLTLCREIRSHFATLVAEGTPGSLRWEGGRIFYQEKEFLLYHLIEFKKQSYYFIPRWQQWPCRFFINSFYISRFPPYSVWGKVIGSFQWLRRFFHEKVLFRRSNS